jgi:hypothetical protein
MRQVANSAFLFIASCRYLHCLILHPEDESNMFLRNIDRLSNKLQGIMFKEGERSWREHVISANLKRRESWLTMDRTPVPHPVTLVIHLSRNLLSKIKVNLLNQVQGFRLTQQPWTWPSTRNRMQTTNFTISLLSSLSNFGSTENW